MKILLRIFVHARYWSVVFFCTVLVWFRFGVCSFFSIFWKRLCKTNVRSLNFGKILQWHCLFFLQGLYLKIKFLCHCKTMPITYFNLSFGVWGNGPLFVPCQIYEFQVSIIFLYCPFNDYKLYNNFLISTSAVFNIFFNSGLVFFLWFFSLLWVSFSSFYTCLVIIDWCQMLWIYFLGC